MRSLLQRFLLAIALGLGVTAGLARAEQPSSAPPKAAEVSGAAVQSVPHEISPVPEEQWSGGQTTSSSERPGLRDRIRGIFPLGCFGHHNHYSCGSLRADCVFMFGSCRQFFGERCLKGPPASPVPGFDWQNLTYNPPGGPGFPAPAPRSGCNCR